MLILEVGHGEEDALVGLVAAVLDAGVRGATGHGPDAAQHVVPRVRQGIAALGGARKQLESTPKDVVRLLLAALVTDAKQAVAHAAGQRELEPLELIVLCGGGQKEREREMMMMKKKVRRKEERHTEEEGGGHNQPL